MVKLTSDLEANVVSVERVKEYTETETEVRSYLTGYKIHDSYNAYTFQYVYVYVYIYIY